MKELKYLITGIRGKSLQFLLFLAKYNSEALLPRQSLMMSGFQHPTSWLKIHIYQDNPSFVSYFLTCLKNWQIKAHRNIKATVRKNFGLVGYR